MIHEMILQPILTGLSVGIFCLTYCFPFMGSFVAAETRSLRQNTFVVLEFLAGRFSGYLCFGITAGYLGEKFDSRWLRLFTDISFILLSVILASYLTGLIRKSGKPCTPHASLKNKSPFAMGFLMGVNLCPPFLLSVAYVISRHSIFYGAVYFTLFFISSSVYFLPLIFLGLLSRTGEFRKAARLSGFAVSILFFIYGVYSILHNIS